MPPPPEMGKNQDSQTIQKIGEEKEYNWVPRKTQLFTSKIRVLHRPKKGGAFKNFLGPARGPTQPGPDFKN